MTQLAAAAAAAAAAANTRFKTMTCANKLKETLGADFFTKQLNVICSDDFILLKCILVIAL